MNSIVLINEKEGIKMGYYLRDIDKISYGKMKDFLTADDIIYNKRKAKESAIQIFFYDGSVATFGKEWHIEFRTF